MKYLVVPDSFKGTLTSAEACETIKENIIGTDPSASVACIHVADGGEGSVDAFLGISGGNKVKISVSGPFFDKTDGFYGLTDGGRTAVIEMAACAGLPLAGDRKDPLKTTTYGVGEMIIDAATRGAKKIIMCLGGSATNDGGCGAAAACGVRFYDRSGKMFIPTGGTLSDIAKIEAREIDGRLAGIEFEAMCDVDNPLCGPDGAARVFAPQKGADEKAVGILDSGLKHLASIISRDLGKDILHIAGAGAAGGMGGGAVAFFGAELKPGIETVLDFAGFDSIINGTDYVITGEGCTDGQSLRGKVVCGVAKRARKAGIPVIVISGSACDDETEDAYGMGVTAVFTINRKAEDFGISAPKSRTNLAYTVRNIIRLLNSRG